MSFFLVSRSKTTVKGPAPESAAVSRAVPTQPGDSRTFVSALTIRLNSAKDEVSALSSAANLQQNPREAISREGTRMSADESSVMASRSSSTTKRESTLVSRKETRTVSKRATNVMAIQKATGSSSKRATSVMSMESSSMLQKEASFVSSKRETGLMSVKSSSILEKEESFSSNKKIRSLKSMESGSISQKEASSNLKRNLTSSVPMDSSSMSQKEASWMMQGGEATLTSYSSEAKTAERSQVSPESSSTSEQTSRSVETRSFTSREESSFSSIMSSIRSSESSFKSIESSSTFWNETSASMSQEVSATFGTKSRAADDLGDKGWYYDLLLRLENLTWNYQNLEAEYAFLERIMAEQKQDLKKAQSWAQGMKKQMPIAEASQVSLD